jgi:Lantibiotic biosynthesis dehydratase C-term
MAQAWVEVNVVPSDPTQPERLLVDVIDPLIHTTLAGRIAIWFFGWYSEPQQFHLRIRILWQQLERSDSDRAALFGELDAAQGSGGLAMWWEGDHGTPGEIYDGEADTYGDLWKLSYQDWNSSSELALALVKQDPDNRGASERQAQWARRAHLHANRLGWNYAQEAIASLAHARGNLAVVGNTSQQIADFVGPIGGVMERLLEQLAQGPSAEP